MNNICIFRLIHAESFHPANIPFWNVSHYLYCGKIVDVIFFYFFIFSPIHYKAVTFPPTISYSCCLQNCFFSVHIFYENYLSIPQYTGCWGNRFQETYVVWGGLSQIPRYNIPLFTFLSPFLIPNLWKI